MDSIAEQLVGRLRRDPNDASAYEALKAHYREVGDIASLANLLEGWAGFQTSPVLASEALVEAARALRETGADLGRIRDLCQRAVDADPESESAALELIAVLEEAAEPHELAEFLDGYLRTLEGREVSPVFVADLYTRLGDLWRDSFDRPDVARPCYEHALELDPSHTAAAYSARKLAQDSGDLASTAKLYAAEADAERDPERKIQLYARLAELHAREMEDVDGAIQALRAALSIAPGDIQVMHQLAGYVAQRALRLDGAERARDQRRVAELYYQIAQGVEPSEALTYLEAALGAAPQHDGALALLEQLAMDLGQADMLPPFWVAYLAQASEGPEVDQRRLYLAQAYERQGQLDDAIFCLGQARSDGAIAQYLAELQAKRGARRSQPPPARSERPGAVAAQAQDASDDDERGTLRPPAGEPREALKDQEDEEDEHEDEERVASDRRETARPARARQPARTSERPLDTAPRLAQLRRAVHELVAQRKNDEAAAVCREILELDANDPEAFSLLESHYRKQRDHSALRDLLLASTRTGGLSVDARKLRLREVAGLCEGKLKDGDGAIEAWQSVVALDPADADAVKSLKRLLQKAQRWDDLAAVLEREALASTSTKEKIDLISQIAAIHRDKRKDLVEAAEALRQLLALRPDAATRDELCEMLLTTESWADAVPLLRERVEEADDEREKLRLLRLVATTLEEKLHDPDGAFEANLAVLALRPKDGEALDRMQRIDEASGNAARLLSTLERRALIAVRSERPAIFVRMGEIAERSEDIDKAAEYYGNALDLDPSHEAALHALSEMFERRGRYADLVELLRERVLLEKDAAKRVESYRRIARLSFERLEQPEEAAEAFRGVLAAREDEEALRFLVGYVREQKRANELASLLSRLIVLITDASERCALLFEQAELYEQELERPREALASLREIVERVDPEYEPALQKFAELCEQVGDASGLAMALERQLSKVTEPSQRAELAQKLAELYEDELRSDENADKAISVLTLWAEADPRNVTPRRRLRERLAGRGRDAEMLAALDALSAWEDDFAAREAATLEAARLSFDALHDVDGAWRRLAPLVEEGHEDALAALSDIARKAGRSAELAGMCVRAAQDAADPEEQGRHWSAAAKIFADDVHDGTQALEAALRMLATNLGNRTYLAQVEDLAARAGAFTRLNQVFDRLLKQAKEDHERVELLVRHAALLDERAHDASEALDRVLRACGLAPSDETLLARAEELAKRAGRSEELLVVYDRKRAKTADERDKVELLLRAARLCDSALSDRDRANNYLKSALAIAKTDATLAPEVVRAAIELDRQHPDRGESAVLRSLVRAHRELSEKADADTGVALILQGHALLKERLDDERGAFDLLRQGATFFPLRDDLYDVLLARANDWKRLDALDAHLSRAIDDALDPKTAAVLISRRARLLEGPLGRPQDAAEAFARLSQLRPDDVEAAEKVRASLRKARRFQDLLLSIHKQLQRVKNADEKLLLLKEAAATWEHDLKNRWEALDAWRKVHDFAPEDADAAAAVARLDRRSVAPPPSRNVAALFDDDATTGAALAAPALPKEAREAAREEEEDETPTVPPSAADDDAAHEPASAGLESELPTVPPMAASSGASDAGDTASPTRDLFASDLGGAEPTQSQGAGDRASEAEPAASAAPAPASVSPTAPLAAASSPWATIAESEPPPAPSDEDAQAVDDELAQLDALLGAPPVTSAPPPADASADTHDIEVDVDVDLPSTADPLPDGRSSAPPPRLTKPPSLPPRRSRSYPPAEPQPEAGVTAAPHPSAPPPLPSARPSQAAPPPVPAPRARKSSAPPTPPARTSRTPSLPPPIPSSRSNQSLPPLPGRPSASPPPLSSSAPSSSPREQSPVRSGPPPLPRKKKQN